MSLMTLRQSLKKYHGIISTLSFNLSDCFNLHPLYGLNPAFSSFFIVVLAIPYTAVTLIIITTPSIHYYNCSIPSYQVHASLYDLCTRSQGLAKVAGWQLHAALSTRAEWIVCRVESVEGVGSDHVTEGWRVHV